MQRQVHRGGVPLAGSSCAERHTDFGNRVSALLLQPAQEVLGLAANCARDRCCVAFVSRCNNLMKSSSEAPSLASFAKFGPADFILVVHSLLQRIVKYADAEIFLCLVAECSRETLRQALGIVALDRGPTSPRENGRRRPT